MSYCPKIPTVTHLDFTFFYKKKKSTYPHVKSYKNSWISIYYPVLWKSQKKIQVHYFLPSYIYIIHISLHYSESQSEDPKSSPHFNVFFFFSKTRKQCNPNVLSEIPTNVYHRTRAERPNIISSTRQSSTMSSIAIVSQWHRATAGHETVRV